ncbi:endopeptidase La [Fangia hongkongensis]|uniref:endopeptidase La n=1 Tax=Fangia hongkongensis TaxID=270495 RepID=UPI00037FAA75|nr:endopeptidase La [Fangia hongkongensis]
MSKEITVEDQMHTNVEEMTEINELVPVVPLRDIVVYPYMAVPLFVGREKSIAAINEAHATKQKILLVTQTSDSIDNPVAKDLYNIGTYAKILQLMKLPDGTFKVLVEGVQRAKVQEYHDDMAFIAAQLHLLKSKDELSQSDEKGFIKALLSSFKNLAEMSGQISKEVLSSIMSDTHLGRLIDTIAAQIQAAVDKKQKVLAFENIKDRASYLLQLLMAEIDVLELEKNIKDRVKSQVEKNQREYYLNEQIKAIYKELGDIDDAQEQDLLKEKVDQAKMSKEATEKAYGELKKLKSMPPSSAEANVSRNYVETLVNLPWTKKTRVKKDLLQAEKVLDEDHFGLEKVKERIVEYLAVQQRMKKIKGPILCLVGPPGVGKTSLGQSIARATGRKYVRMALGGVKDEAEIRGHRRTYIGALPGQIMQKITKAGVNNPLFLLDEIDKMSADFRGDPASAMLEVLDPEQNNTFNDHYLEVDYDLSDVMFVATANSLNIPDALRDRMEIIYLSGYTEDEKMNIALNYLVPKAIKDNGLKESEITIDKAVIMDIIRYYTREAGVRRLQQEINKLCRKTVKKILLTNKKDKSSTTKKTKAKAVRITSKNLNDYLGVKRYDYGLAQEQNAVGQVTGLAWTEVGGDLLTIEAVAVSGKGKLKTTGKLGEVMEESIHAAMTVVRTKAKEFGVKDDFYDHHDFHIHVPEGATPKDGPSAGIAMCTAMLSAMSGKPVRKEVAMTGEITLRGDVLPIGGLKEKLLAALRGGITTVLIPKDNEKDLQEIPDNVKEGLAIIPVKTIDEVLSRALFVQN